MRSEDSLARAPESAARESSAHGDSTLDSDFKSFPEREGAASNSDDADADTGAGVPGDLKGTGDPDTSDLLKRDSW